MRYGLRCSQKPTCGDYWLIIRIVAMTMRHITNRKVPSATHSQSRQVCTDHILNKCTKWTRTKAPLNFRTAVLKHFFIFLLVNYFNTETNSTCVTEAEKNSHRRWISVKDTTVFVQLLKVAAAEYSSWTAGQIRISLKPNPLLHKRMKDEDTDIWETSDNVWGEDLEWWLISNRTLSPL